MVGHTVAVHYLTLCDISGLFALRGMQVTQGYNPTDHVLPQIPCALTSGSLADFSPHISEMTSCP